MLEGLDHHDLLSNMDRIETLGAEHVCAGVFEECFAQVVPPTGVAVPGAGTPTAPKLIRGSRLVGAGFALIVLPARAAADPSGEYARVL